MNYIGAGFAGIGLANTAVKWDGKLVAQSFIAPRTARIVGARFYLIDRDGGYGGGTGGDIRIHIHPDDGTGLPDMTSASVGEIRVLHQRENEEMKWWTRYEFSEPVLVLKGVRYHYVASNVDPEPAKNYVSMDLLYMASGPKAEELTHHYYHPNSGWVQRPYLPIFVSYFEDGGVHAQPFINSLLTMSDKYQHRQPIGSGREVRRFWQSTEIVELTTLNLYARRLFGNGPLGFTILSSNPERQHGTYQGEVIYEGYLEPRSRPCKISQMQWFRGNCWCDIPADREISIIFWSDHQTQYETGAHRYGSGYGYLPEYGMPGRAQWRDSIADAPGHGNGSQPWQEWEVWAKPYKQVDLMWYAEVAE